jgi:hypothetical protein
MIADQGYPGVSLIGHVEAGPPSVAVES